MHLSSSRSRCLFIGALWIIIALMAGCSQGSEPTAVNPDEDLRQNTAVEWPSFGNTGHSSWGLWQFTVDKAAKQLDIVPIRGASFHLNVLPYLEPPLLVNLYPDWSTLNINFENNTLQVVIKVRHPFIGKHEFTGFDVKGILISNGYQPLNAKPNDNGEVFATYGEPRLDNPDGLVRWWNAVEFLGEGVFGYEKGGLGAPGVFSATLNGYKYFCEGLGPDEDMGSFDMADRGHFPAGGVLQRRFMIDFGEDQSNFMIFNYAVDASWQFPNAEPPEVPDDFPISANCTEPFWIETAILTNDLYFLAAADKGGGTVEMMITVHDWQGVDTIGEVYIDNAGVFTESILCEPQPVTDPFERDYYVITDKTSNISSNDPQDIIIAAYIDDTTYQQSGMVDFWGPPGAKVAAYQRVSLPCNAIPAVKLAEEENTLLLTPYPFTLDKDFSVIGNPEKAGVYYFGPAYTIYRYPLDYSLPGELYDDLDGFLNWSQDDLWEFPIKLSRLDMTQAGEYVLFSNSTAIYYLNPYLKRDFAYQFDSENDPYGHRPVQGISPGTSTGIMKVLDISATTNFDDTDVVFWIHIDDDLEPSIPHEDVTVPLLYYRYPYGPDIFNGDIGAISGSPVPKGNGNGAVDPDILEAFAVCGIPFTADIGEYDIMCGFLEGSPKNEVEVFGINCNDPTDSSNEYISTIKNFVGLPKDIEIFPAVAGGVDDDIEWLVVLEQGAANEVLVEVFTLDGFKKDTSDIYTGSPIAIDIDPYNYKVHIWFHDTDLPGNPVRAVVFGFEV